MNSERLQNRREKQALWGRHCTLLARFSIARRTKFADFDKPRKKNLRQNKFD